MHLCKSLWMKASAKCPKGKRKPKGKGRSSQVQVQPQQTGPVHGQDTVPRDQLLTAAGGGVRDHGPDEDPRCPQRGVLDQQGSKVKQGGGRVKDQHERGPVCLIVTLEDWREEDICVCVWAFQFYINILYLGRLADAFIKSDLQ